MSYIIENPDRVLEQTVQHVQLVAISIVLAILIGVPVGIMITRVRWLEGPVIGTTGVLYTVPSLALFAILIPYTGLGRTTVVVALVLYSLLAVVRNTVTGIDDVPRATLDAARGMGMTGRSGCCWWSCRWRCRSSWPACGWRRWRRSASPPSPH